jgi:hypothetical protein
MNGQVILIALITLGVWYGGREIVRGVEKAGHAIVSVAKKAGHALRRHKGQ